MSKQEIVSKSDLIKILDLIENLGIKYWLDGGWGVDILHGKQTREHRDVDINFDSRYMDKLVEALEAEGYEITTDFRPVRIEFHHIERGYIDIHPFVLGDNGTARQADLDGGWYEFDADFFGTVDFEGREIPCISAKGQKLFHQGYELRETDRHDIKIIENLLS